MVCYSKELPHPPLNARTVRLLRVSTLVVRKKKKKDLTIDFSSVCRDIYFKQYVCARTNRLYYNVVYSKYDDILKTYFDNQHRNTEKKKKKTFKSSIPTICFFSLIEDKNKFARVLAMIVANRLALKRTN